MTEIFGLLNLHKPVGCTSRWLVDFVSRATGVKKIGHAGTLDPLASGVLVLCLGPATRLVEYVQAGTKVYQAQVTLGVSTTSYDREGEVVSTRPVPPLAADDVQALLARYVGDIVQQPPAFSAVKVDGVAAYRRARRGQVLDLALRTVHLSQLQLLQWNPPHFTVEIHCSPGTYVRSLAHDWGEALGCGAHLSGLIRLASGHFRLEDSVQPETLAEAARAGAWQQYLLAPDEAVRDLVAVNCDEAAASTLQHGNAIHCPSAPATLTGRAYDPHGRFIALVVYDADHQQWRPHKVFVND